MLSAPHLCGGTAGLEDEALAGDSGHPNFCQEPYYRVQPPTSLASALFLDPAPTQVRGLLLLSQGSLSAHQGLLSSHAPFPGFLYKFSNQGSALLFPVGSCFWVKVMTNNTITLMTGASPNHSGRPHWEEIPKAPSST